MVTLARSEAAVEVSAEDEHSDFGRARFMERDGGRLGAGAGGPGVVEQKDC